MIINTTNVGNLLNALLGKTASATTIFTSEHNCWLGLYKTMPTSAGTGGVEPTAAQNYQRVEISNFMTVTPANRSATNSSDINFNAAINPNDPSDDTPSFGWDEIVGFGLFSSSSTTTPYAWGEISPTVTVVVKSTPHFLKNKFEITITDSGSLSATVNP